MRSTINKNLSRSISEIHIFVLFSGLAALSWEVIWQLKSTLALGVSAWGTAITLAVTMGGMSLGSVLMGHLLKNKASVRPLRLYGILELIVGASGLCLTSAFSFIEIFDSWAYQIMPDSIEAVYLFGIVCALGVPTLCLGATIPIIGLASKQYGTSISVLYGLNTLGAACGALIAAFLLIPLFGVLFTIFIVSSLNIVIGLMALSLDKGAYTPEVNKPKTGLASDFTSFQEFLIVFVTGFATFTLEIAWFRSLTAAFLSTTIAFSIMLCAVLLALGFGARIVPYLRYRKVSLGALLSISGMLILVATPIIERFDYFITPVTDGHPYILFAKWFLLIFYVIGAPMLFLGIALPWVLENQSSTRKWGTLYGLNAFSSILGAIIAGWVLLPTIGFAKAAWVAGIMVVLIGVFILKEKRLVYSLLGVLALSVSIGFYSGVGTKRVQISSAINSDVTKILQTYEGPDATVSAVEHENGERTLVIDGFIATSQAATDDNMFDVQYMNWMGHLPMLLHSDPKKALVICFGTGQTANAVRKENPETLDIAEVNARVLKLAPYFKTNQGVLDDPKVTTIVMDGRAYLRRTTKIYDVITLEPMPPTFAGVNALYSKEFYQLARNKLSDDGMIAQWLPFHLLSPYLSASITRTFQSVFPNSILWIDPTSATGILLGTMDETRDLGVDFPGYARTQIKRPLPEEKVKKLATFNKDLLFKFGLDGDVITDDNQILSYGQAAYLIHKNDRENVNRDTTLDILEGIYIE